MLRRQGTRRRKLSFTPKRAALGSRELLLTISHAPSRLPLGVATDDYMVRIWIETRVRRSGDDAQISPLYRMWQHPDCVLGTPCCRWPRISSQ